jgi:hypothetical protein
MTSTDYKFGTWYPIESKPKIGEFLVWLREPLFGSNTWPMRIRENGITLIAGQFHFEMSAPTHWMPLPPPPGAEWNFSNEAGSDAVSLIGPTSPPPGTKGIED